jgi:altronate dehydratase small subunit
MKSAVNLAPKAVVLHDDDDVAVLLEALEQDTVVTVSRHGETIPLRIREPLPLGHKIALRDLPAGHHVRKYGEVIGALSHPVTAGEHVHVHNLKSLRA